MNPSHAVQRTCIASSQWPRRQDNRNRETSAKFSQITPSDRFTLGAPCRIPNRILICASGAKFVDDFCLELPVTRGKSFAATPRHLHQSTIRLN